MKACWPMNRASRALVVIVPLLFALPILSGCELDGYPDDLEYPMRSDPLAVEKPKEDAPAYDLPGEFPKELFVGLPEQQRKDVLLDIADVSQDQRRELNGELIKIFGSPAHPTAKVGELEKTLKLDEETLKEGSTVYRQQCLHCHGLSGDGRGATAPWVNPHPRDYRQGIFKFTSSGQEEGRRKPRREDIIRTLREGIEGTSMPSFRLLADEDLEALASYVVHLSLRGELEYQVLRALKKQEAEPKMEDNVKAYLELVTGNWQAAQTSLIQPGKFAQMNEKDLRESAKRGFGLFSRPSPVGNLKSAGCLGCHTDFGRRSAHKYDAWGTIVKPTDLTNGILRGGRRPIDLYWRIHSGINGVTMPASSQNLSADEIWDIVNFLKVLPFPKMLKEYGIELEQAK